MRQFDRKNGMRIEHFDKPTLSVSYKKQGGLL